MIAPLCYDQRDIKMISVEVEKKKSNCDRIEKNYKCTAFKA
jgi:hypothetical protein